MVIIPTNIESTGNDISGTNTQGFELFNDSSASGSVAYKRAN